MEITYLQGNIKIISTKINEIFSIDNEIDLTNFIKNISDMDKKIEIDPVSFEVFEDTNKGIEPTALKLIDYIYKILEAFNESFDEVYSIKTEEDEIIL